jgi:hypothetical protein
MPKNKHSLTTDEVALGPGKHAILSTPYAEHGFEIAAMTAKGEPLFFRLHAADRSCGEGEARLIYEADEPQDFDDFLVSFAEGGGEFADAEDGNMRSIGAADIRPEHCLVRAGERLLLNVFNQTDKVITARVTFSGPEL